MPKAAAVRSLAPGVGKLFADFNAERVSKKGKQPLKLSGNTKLSYAAVLAYLESEIAARARDAAELSGSSTIRVKDVVAAVKVVLPYELAKPILKRSIERDEKYFGSAAATEA